jgi:hypothetical protein
LEFKKISIDAIHLLLYANFVDGEEVKEIGELWVIQGLKPASYMEAD